MFPLPSFRADGAPSSNKNVAAVQPLMLNKDRFSEGYSTASTITSPLDNPFRFGGLSRPSPSPLDHFRKRYPPRLCRPFRCVFNI